MRWVLAVLLISQVCSVLSQDSNEASLNIRAKLSVNNIGEKKAIYCEGANLIEPMEWYSPTEKKIELKSTKNNRIYVEKHEEPKYIALIIRSTKIEDTGTWTCKSGDLNATIQIIVGEKVNIKVRRESLEADEGKSVKLICEAKGIPPPVVLWYVNGVPTPEDTPKYITTHNKENIYSLEIKNLTHEDSGEYTCKVRQESLSHYTDKTITLSVHHKPIIYNYDTKELYNSKFKTEEIFAVMNDTKNITCSAIANPPPVFSWSRRINNFDKPITDTDLIITSEDMMSSVYILRMNDESDTGIYKCMATNPKGKVTILFDVTAGAKPEKPDDIALISANASYLTFNVSCSNCIMMQEEPTPLDPRNLPVIAYSFQLVPVKTDFPPDWDNATEFMVDITDPEDTTFIVGPLANGTQFEVRVRSQNAAGFSDWLEWTGSEKPSTTSYAVRLVATLVLVILALQFTSYY